MSPLFWIVLGLVEISLELEINITNFENCHDALPAGEKWPIELQEVHYQSNDKGFIHRVHGTYLVRTIDTRDKELTIIVYKCSIDDPPPCEHKVEQIIVDLNCDKFQNDDSGIWHMVSQAMTGSTCGDEMGLFEFEIPEVKPEYFVNYLIGGEQNSRYRMHLLFHKKNDELKDRRACGEIHFDVYH